MGGPGHIRTFVEHRRPRRKIADRDMAAIPNPAAGRYPVAAAVLGLLLAGTFIPSPLYELYRRAWGLTTGEISFVFAVYAGSLIPSLLFLGGLSDKIGRRRALFLALGISALGSLTFAFASNLWWLVGARVLQGVAIGVGSGAATAAVRDWMDEAMRARAGAVSLIGIALGSSTGALLGGALGQYAPYPTMLPYLVHIALVAVVASALMTVPASPQPAPTKRRALPSVPAALRRPFALVSIESFVAWAGQAICVSLLPTFLSRSLDLHNLLAGTAAVIEIQAGYIVSSYVGRLMSNRVAIAVGMIAVAGGLWCLLSAVAVHAYVAIALATIVIGIGSGLGYLSGLNVVITISPPDQRAELISLLLVASYIGFSVPALGVGIAANQVGLQAAIAAASAILTVIALVSIVLISRRSALAPTTA